MAPALALLHGLKRHAQTLRLNPGTEDCHAYPGRRSWRRRGGARAAAALAPRLPHDKAASVYSARAGAAARAEMTCTNPEIKPWHALSWQAQPEEARRGLARAAARLLPRLLRDRVANVYGAALALLRALLAARPAAAPVADLVPVLLDRVRCASACSRTLQVVMSLADDGVEPVAPASPRTFTAAGPHPVARVAGKGIQALDPQVPCGPGSNTSDRVQVGENNTRVHAAACAALLELATAPGGGLGPHLALVTRPAKSQLQVRRGPEHHVHSPTLTLAALWCKIPMPIPF